MSISNVEGVRECKTETEPHFSHPFFSYWEYGEIEGREVWSWWDSAHV